MNRKQYIVELVASITGDTPTAEEVVDRLNEEGLLVLGYGDNDVDRIVEKFKDTFGTTRTSKYDRFAASRLAKKYDAQAVVGIIGLLGEASGEKFAPVCNSVSELESKFVSIMSFLRKQGKDEVIVV